MRGEKSSLKGVAARDACDSNAGACVGNRRGGGLLGVQYFCELLAGGTVGLFHRSGRGRGKTAVLLALGIGSRGRSHAGIPSRSRCPKLGPSSPFWSFPVRSRVRLSGAVSRALSEYLYRGVTYGGVGQGVRLPSRGVLSVAYFFLEPGAIRVRAVCPVYRVTQGKNPVDNFWAERGALFGG